jgi:uncharacterized damage-inducible protein DinB
LKRIALSAAVVSVLLLTAPASTTAQETGTLAADLRADWAGQHDQIADIADAMPEDAFGYKATDAQRTYGEQALHIVEVNVALLGMLDSPVAAPAINTDATSKADILMAVEQSYTYGAEVLAGLSDAQMLEAVDGRFLGQSTRARVIAFAFSHTMDIYGQMAVYLRLNDIVPPASRRGGL